MLDVSKIALEFVKKNIGAISGLEDFALLMKKFPSALVEKQECDASEKPGSAADKDDYEEW